MFDGVDFQELIDWLLPHLFIGSAILALTANLDLELWAKISLIIAVGLFYQKLRNIEQKNCD